MTDTWGLSPFVFPYMGPGVDYTPPPFWLGDGSSPPVLRIPVAGPAPFNTLAVVRGRAGITPHLTVADGTMDHGTVMVPTHLIIPGFDPARPVAGQVRHSTSASIVAMMAGPQKDIFVDDGSTFTVAIDAVHAEARITETGQFSVMIDTASSHDQTIAAEWLEMTSWVLYRDPNQVAPGGESTAPVRSRWRFSRWLFTVILRR